MPAEARRATLPDVIDIGGGRGPGRLLRAVDAVVHRIDRASGLRARRERRTSQDADHDRFAYELGRWIGPVAERCGYGEVQLGATHAVFCGDPAEVLAKNPWLADLDAGADLADGDACVDLQVDWRDGWVELRADPFVRRSLFAPAADRDTLGSALEAVADQLVGSLDARTVLDGAGLSDDPRPSDGSTGWLRLREVDPSD